MVERFNSRINELLQKTRFDSRADLEKTLFICFKLYSHNIPQHPIGIRTPIQAIKDWQHAKPNLFVKRVYEHAKLDN